MTELLLCRLVAHDWNHLAPHYVTYQRENDNFAPPSSEKRTFDCQQHQIVSLNTSNFDVDGHLLSGACAQLEIGGVRQSLQHKGTMNARNRVEILHYCSPKNHLETGYTLAFVYRDGTSWRTDFAHQPSPDCCFSRAHCSS